MRDINVAIIGMLLITLLASGCVEGNASGKTYILDLMDQNGQDVNFPVAWIGTLFTNLLVTANDLNIIDDINGSKIQADYFFGGKYFGDSSNLTGIPTDLNSHLVPYIGADYDVDLGAYDLTTTGRGTFGTITSGDITVFDALPILIFKDSDSAGSASKGFIEWRDSTGGRLGFFGNSSAYNDNLVWKNEVSDGNIEIKTTEGGGFNVFANIDAQDNYITTTGTGTFGAAVSIVGSTAILDITSTDTATNEGHSRLRFNSAGKIGQTANTKNFAFNNANAGATQNENSWILQSRNDDGTFKGNLFTVLQNSGKFGVGVTAPLELLDVFGNLKVGNSTTDHLRIRLSTIHMVIEKIGATGNIYIRPFVSGDTSGNLILNDLGGSVGIGTSNPTDTLTVDGNISSKKDIKAAGDIYYGGALVSYSPSILCDAHSNKCLATDFETKTTTWCDKTDGEWVCDTPNENIQQKLEKRDQFKTETAEKEACTSQGAGWEYADGKCSFNQQKQCEASEYSYWQDGQCRENLYLKCLTLPLKQWNASTLKCEDNPVAICRQEQDFDYIGGECVFSQERKDERLRQEQQEIENACREDRSKYWNGSECVSVGILTAT